ncbi:glutaredoxin domain-containing protein [Geomonas sp.]|uniref:glutaredoxin domain-containing protein n=1 Tax=Geomonas sp. TaxID=2651584 RepID=UPI002B46F705|nr:glutaredoxin domain-containing protein [Geomonas sp.]HJV34431.1 glutaredoxin domain-containing protein [Geomonas sp.]
MRLFAAVVLALCLSIPSLAASTSPGSLPQSTLSSQSSLAPPSRSVSTLSVPLSQTQLPEHIAPALVYPKIVLYSVSWCPHCKAAKEYFTKNNIPFINRDVEIDSEAYRLLTSKYKSQGVPVIVIGDDQEIIRGFDEKSFEKTLERYKK